MVDQESSTNAEYLIGQLNVTNAKKVAVLMVLGFMCYHGLIHLRYGMNSLNKNTLVEERIFL